MNFYCLLAAFFSLQLIRGGSLCAELPYVGCAHGAILNQVKGEELSVICVEALTFEAVEESLAHEPDILCWPVVLSSKDTLALYEHLYDKYAYFYQITSPISSDGCFIASNFSLENFTCIPYSENPNEGVFFEVVVKDEGEEIARLRISDPADKEALPEVLGVTIPVRIYILM